MQSGDIRHLESVFSEPRFTMADACAASGMTAPRLRKWTNTILKRYFPLRQAGQWVRYSFTDIVQLALAQDLMDVGIGAVKAFDWADDAARGILRPLEYAGSILIYREPSGETRFRLVEAVGEAAAIQLYDKPLGIVINVLAVADRVMRRLIASGALAASEGSFSDVLRDSRERRRRADAGAVRSTPHRTAEKAAGPSPTPGAPAPPRTRPRRSRATVK
jgi:hypothetical protein